MDFLEANRFRVTDPERIPAQRYYDEAFFKDECENLWPHVWQMACRLEQIQEIGDWIEYSNLGKSVIVVRTKDGVKAFHNACRHRGVALAEPDGHGNCKTEGFICPFHGWRWNMEGKNTFVYGKHMFSERQLDGGDLAMKPCRVETDVGCAFINFDDDAPSLRESMGPLLERMDAHHFGQMRAEWWFSTVLPANWKTAMEAFMEGWHVMRTHPQLQVAIPSLYNGMYGVPNAPGIMDPNVSAHENIRAYYEHMKILNKGMAGQVHEKEVEIMGQMLEVDLPEDPQEAFMVWNGMVNEQITKQLGAKGEPVPDLNKVMASAPLKAVEFLFPHYFVLPIFSNAASYRVRPLGPESCIFELFSLTFHPEGKEPPPVMEPHVVDYRSQEFPEIPRQDYSNIPLQQVGLKAAGFEFMRLAQGVEGLISNYQRLIDGYIARANPDTLASAYRTIGGGFDGPILHYDF